MITIVQIESLADSWVNGNRSHVLSVLHCARKTNGMALLACIARTLNERGIDPVVFLSACVNRWS